MKRMNGTAKRAILMIEYRTMRRVELTSPV
jgi:hypothetical protein